MKTTGIFLVLLLSVTSHLNAQLFFKTEYFGMSKYRVMDKNSDERVGNCKGSAIVYQAGIDVPFSVKTNDGNSPTIWGIGVGGAYASLDNRNFTEDLVLDEIMDLGINLYHRRPLWDKWSILATIGAGIYSPGTDFSQITYKNILGNTGAVMIYQFRPNLELGGGVAINNTFGYPMVFPAFYFNCAISGKFFVKVSVLDGLKASAGYIPAKYLELSMVTDMSAQMALIEKDGEDQIFTHQYIVGGFRPKLKLGKYVSIPITVGVHAIRVADFSERSLKSIFSSDKSYYFQVSPYVSAGLEIGF